MLSHLLYLMIFVLCLLAYGYVVYLIITGMTIQITTLGCTLPGIRKTGYYSGSKHFVQTYTLVPRGLTLLHINKRTNLSCLWPTRPSMKPGVQGVLTLEIPKQPLLRIFLQVPPLLWNFSEQPGIRFLQHQ